MKFTTIFVLIAVSLIDVNQALRLKEDAEMKARVSAAIVDSALNQALSIV